MLRLHLNRCPTSPDGSAKKVSDLTVEELKSVIHDVIDEDMEAWRETFEILADKKLMRQIKQPDQD